MLTDRTDIVITQSDAISIPGTKVPGCAARFCPIRSLRLGARWYRGRIPVAEFKIEKEALAVQAPAVPGELAAD